MTGEEIRKRMDPIILDAMGTCPPSVLLEAVTSVLAGVVYAYLGAREGGPDLSDEMWASFITIMGTQIRAEVTHAILTEGKNPLEVPQPDSVN